MPCDYYVEKSTVIEYMRETGEISILVYNILKYKGYLLSYSVDVKDRKDQNYKNLLDRALKKHTYIKILYDEDGWAKDKYQENYRIKLEKKNLDPSRVVKIYKDYTSWPR
jgi:hypothetical protein